MGWGGKRGAEVERVESKKVESKDGEEYAQSRDFRDFRGKQKESDVAVIGRRRRREDHGGDS